MEIEILGQWGTVSNSNWDNSDARVVCRMLGYKYVDYFLAHIGDTFCFAFPVRYP